jgi:hypothetical protein
VTSVADPNPDPDPPDPQVFGPPGSFYHQKTLIPTALLLCDVFLLLSLKMM